MDIRSFFKPKSQQTKPKAKEKENDHVTVDEAAATSSSEQAPNAKKPSTRMCRNATESRNGTEEESPLEKKTLVSKNRDAAVSSAKKCSKRKGSAVAKKGAALKRKSKTSYKQHLPTTRTNSKLSGRKFKKPTASHFADSSDDDVEYNVESEHSDDSFESEEQMPKKRSGTCRRRRAIEESDEDDEVQEVIEKGPMRKQTMAEAIEKMKAKKPSSTSSKPVKSDGPEDQALEFVDPDDFFACATAKKTRRTDSALSDVEMATTSGPAKGQKPSTKNPAILSPSKPSVKSLRNPGTTDIISEMSQGFPEAGVPATSAMQKQREPSEDLVLAGSYQDSKQTAEQQPKKGAPRWLQPKADPPNLGSKEIPQGPIDCLQGFAFVVTGVLDSLQREDAEDLIKRHGGRVTKSVSGKTTHLVAGEDPGESKLCKAKAKNVQIIDEDGLLDLIRKAAKTAPHSKSTLSSSSSSSSLSSSSKTSAPRPVKLPAPQTAGPPTDGVPASSMWVDKYKPSSTSDLIGNNSCITKLKNFLQNWPPTGKHPRAVLLSGPPGIGKSSAASICVKEAGFTAVEMNASDSRSKRLLSDNVSTMTQNRSLFEFFSVHGKRPALSKSLGSERSVLIMDEVDGMSSGDRGGMNELIKLIKTTNVPIVCICNDRQSPKVRSLANYCEDLRFRRPTSQQIRARIGGICKKEGLRIDPAALDKLHEGSGGDIRQVLNSLQMLRIGRDHVSFDDAKSSLESGHKDFDLGAFDVAPKLLRAVTPHDTNWINDRSSLYFVDPSLLPLMVQDNYLKCRPSLNQQEVQMSPQQREFAILNRYSNAALVISDGDLISQRINSSQSWGLMPLHAAFSTVAPAFFVGGGLSSPINFPQWLGKNSTKRKNQRIAADLRTHMALRVTGDSSTIVLDYLPVLRQRLSAPLIEQGQDGIDEVIAQMDYYGLTRDDFDSLLEIGQSFLGEVKIASQVKSAFTRTYKARAHVLPAALGKKKRKKEQPAKDINMDDEAEHSDDDLPLSNDDFDEEDEANDRMIVKKKKAPAKSKSSAKRTSSSSSSRAKRRKV